jgi:hypothetical protein
MVGQARPDARQTRSKIIERFIANVDVKRRNLGHAFHIRSLHVQGRIAGETVVEPLQRSARAASFADGVHSPSRYVSIGT